jgi:hypothetical protein
VEENVAESDGGEDMDLDDASDDEQQHGAVEIEMTQSKQASESQDAEMSKQPVEPVDAAVSGERRTPSNPSLNHVKGDGEDPIPTIVVHSPSTTPQPPPRNETALGGSIDLPTVTPRTAGTQAITGLTYQFPPPAVASQADLDAWARQASEGRYPAGCAEAPPEEVLRTMRESQRPGIKKTWRR